MSDLTALVDLFYPATNELGQFDLVAASDLSESYCVLLAHDDHMTVTVEAFHDSLVDVQVLEERNENTFYARKILLKRRSDNRIVLFGIMKVCLDIFPEAARKEVTAREIPLGRILIRHNVMRHVHLEHIWQVTPGSELCKHFGLSPSKIIYGRTARILVENKPAVELLEIVSS